MDTATTSNAFVMNIDNFLCIPVWWYDKDDNAFSPDLHDTRLYVMLIKIDKKLWICILGWVCLWGHVFMSYGGVVMKVSRTDGEVSTLELFTFVSYSLMRGQNIYTMYLSKYCSTWIILVLSCYEADRESAVVPWNLQVSILYVFVLLTHMWSLVPKCDSSISGQSKNTMGKESLTDLEDSSLVQSLESLRFSE
jgi:hypothetical protein